jgi:hypothetical protein
MRFMTNPERLAHRHLVGTMKATKGRSDVLAQEEARGHKFYFRLVSDDPDIAVGKLRV